MAISLDAPLDLQAPEASAFLSGIEGNILKSHGRDHAAHVFRTFESDASAARALGGRGSSHSHHLRHPAKEGSQYMGQRWRSRQALHRLSLSYTGYRALGIEEIAIPIDLSGSYFRGRILLHSQSCISQLFGKLKRLIRTSTDPWPL
jgi:hypothetical protein